MVFLSYIIRKSLALCKINSLDCISFVEIFPCQHRQNSDSDLRGEDHLYQGTEPNCAVRQMIVNGQSQFRHIICVNGLGNVPTSFE